MTATHSTLSYCWEVTQHARSPVSEQCSVLPHSGENMKSIIYLTWSLNDTNEVVVLYTGPSINATHLNADTNTLKGSCRNCVSLKAGFNWFKYSSMVDILNRIVNPPFPWEEGNCTPLERLFVSQEPLFYNISHQGTWNSPMLLACFLLGT